MEWFIYWGLIIIILLLNSNTKESNIKGNISTNKPPNIPNPAPNPQPIDPELSADRTRLREWSQEECKKIIDANTSKHLFANKAILEIGYSDLLNTNEWKFKRNKILIRDGYSCKKCNIISKSLHVHHLSYIQDELPWSINDDQLISVCYSCHKKIHDNEVIPVYRRDAWGNLLQTDNRTLYCFRCNGAGWFPQFKHVEAGICFRCRGNCIESTIFSNAIKVFTLKSNSDYEDTLIGSIQDFYSKIDIEIFRKKIKHLFFPSTSTENDLPF